MRSKHINGSKEHYLLGQDKTSIDDKLPSWLVLNFLHCLCLLSVEVSLVKVGVENI